MDDSCPEANTDRRTFLADATAAITGLTILSGAGAQGQGIKPETRVLDDPRVQHGNVMFTHGGHETIDGFLARPKAEGRYTPVLVIAGNRITEEYIPNTCAALALAGFVGLAPNIFHPLPDSARSPAELRAALVNHSELDVLADVQAGADYLRGKPFVKEGPIGVLGFCFGGRMAMLYGARSRDVDAVVPYHPGPVTAAEVARLRSPVQVHCGTSDRNVSVDSIRDLEKILRAQSTPVDVHLYEGADHGFLAYTRPTYKVDAAKLSWTRSVEFLRKHLPR
ncbi:MAG TPA: dienelactone hydrolase family protein [Gemmatimonadaceae bacterium]|nr:dienelactone hydrolase family protein [Gemmatimonadaceae bacterium]